MLTGLMLTTREVIKFASLGRHVRFNGRSQRLRKLKPSIHHISNLQGGKKIALHSRPMSTTTRNNAGLEDSMSDGSPDTLQGYLRYAMFRNLNINSTVFVGSVYELQVKQYLESQWPLPISKATIVGGSGDRGVDIDACMGQYRLLVQCKCYSSQRVDPKLLREIKGAIQDIPPNSSKEEIPLVAMIACTNSFTRQGRSEFDKATIPMIFLKFSRPKLIDVTKPYDINSWEWGKMIGWETNWKAQNIGLAANTIEIKKKRTVKKKETNK